MERGLADSTWRGGGVPSKFCEGGDQDRSVDPNLKGYYSWVVQKVPKKLHTNRIDLSSWMYGEQLWKKSQKKKRATKKKKEGCNRQPREKKKFFVCRCSFVRSQRLFFRRSAPVLASVDICEGGIRNIIYGVGDGVRRANYLPEMHEPQASGGERWKEGWQIPAKRVLASSQRSAKVATRTDPSTPTSKGTTHGSPQKCSKSCTQIA